jgi:predicted acetyltransferase
MSEPEIRLATREDRTPLQRMLELYQHDLSHVWDQDLDAHGEYGYSLDKYWSNPACKAFVFRVAGRFAGFGLVDDRVSLPENQWWMSQFFVLKKYRRSGVGHAGARAIFDAIRGRWEIGQMPGNDAAVAFWRRVIDGYTGGRYVEHHLDDERWRGHLQCFVNTAG